MALLFDEPTSPGPVQLSVLHNFALFLLTRANLELFISRLVDLRCVGRKTENTKLHRTWGIPRLGLGICSKGDIVT